MVIILQVAWKYFEGETWHRYDKKHNWKIEKAYNAGKTTVEWTETVDDHTKLSIFLNFSSMIEITDLNPTKQRTVQRRNLLGIHCVLAIFQ